MVLDSALLFLFIDRVYACLIVIVHDEQKKTRKLSWIGD